MLGIAPTARAASTIVVPRDYRTIQAAVNAAPSGSTIVVRGGIYTEQVVISGKNLTLEGVGGPVIKSPRTLTSFAQDTRSNRPVTSVVRITNGAHVRMSGFSVTGPLPCGTTSAGVTALQDARLDLSDSRITDMHPASSCPADQAGGRGVVFGLPSFVQVNGVSGSRASGSVCRVKIARYLLDGINVAGPDEGSPARVVVTDSAIAGGSQIPVEQFGISIGNAVATVTNNTISDSVCTDPACGPDPITQLQSGGVFAGFGAPAGTTVSGNHISRTDTGIYQFASPDCCRIRSNFLRNNRFFGIAIQDGNGATHHNVITGGQVGIGVIADSVDTTAILHGDRITGTTVAPVREIQCCGFTATAVVKPD
ncbi:right-handed parallel beta-helix repeat-containing protein [Streptomyces sp. NPDC001817]|uniref:right-handed parallel beta-helix repeat-containing protein n=1 Tax=Streptomyces sp. NPDC001817 TaxID=3154398 RepID=UPI00332E2F35